MPHLAGRVFISYRREDSRHPAGRLNDRIAARFDRVHVFMDVDTITPGDDFGEAISQAVSSCQILIAMIGPGWLSAMDSRGRRRLDNPHDWVRQEIRVALTRGIRVIPVLVDGAPMLSVADLPPDLSALARRNAARLDHETFTADMEPLLDTIAQTLMSEQEPTRPELSPSRSGSTGGQRRQQHPSRASSRDRTDERVVPLHRTVGRIVLWILVFALAIFSSGGLGLTLAGKVRDPGGSIIVVVILFGFVAAMLLWIRKEVADQRSMIDAAADSTNAHPLMPVSLSPARIRTLHISLGALSVLFACLLWLTS